MIIVMVIRIILLFVIHLMMIHLGKNPMNGGNPANDRKLIINESLVILFLFNDILI